MQSELRICYGVAAVCAVHWVIDVSYPGALRLNSEDCNYQSDEIRLPLFTNNCTARRGAVWLDNPIFAGACGTILLPCEWLMACEGTALDLVCCRKGGNTRWDCTNLTAELGDKRCRLVLAVAVRLPPLCTCRGFTFTKASSRNPFSESSNFGALALWPTSM